MMPMEALRGVATASFVTPNLYIGLIAGPNPVLASDDTLASHAGWVEFTGYAGNRKLWDEQGAGDVISGVLVRNSPPAEFSITTTGQVAGFFLATDSTKGGTTGELRGVALLPSSLDVKSGERMKVVAQALVRGG